jgi:hypothetical protein
MAERKRQYATYTDDELGDRIENTADAVGISVAELLRRGARKQLQAVEEGQ